MLEVFRSPLKLKGGGTVAETARQDVGATFDVWPFADPGGLPGLAIMHYLTDAGQR